MKEGSQLLRESETEGELTLCIVLITMLLIQSYVVNQYFWYFFS